MTKSRENGGWQQLSRAEFFTFQWPPNLRLQRNEANHECDNYDDDDGEDDNDEVDKEEEEDDRDN